MNSTTMSNIPKKIWRMVIDTPLNKLWDYLPLCSADGVDFQRGQRFLVPFGRRKLVAILWDIVIESDIAYDKLKTPIEPLDSASLFNELWRKQCQWMAEYYHVALADIAMTFIPGLLKQPRCSNDFKTTYYELTEPGRAIMPLLRAPKQNKLLDYLLSHKQVEKANLVASGYSHSLINKSVDQGYVASHQKVMMCDSSPLSLGGLNDEQQNAVNKIQSVSGFHTFLLYGVTGSGKTEVYYRIVEKLIKNHGQVLILIPEIALSDQTVKRFEHRFGHAVVSYHSGLTEKNRVNAWMKAQSGQAKIVIGTRSAVMCVMPKLQCIIVDEEHDSSYKQFSGLRYSARDCAIRRAQLHDIPIILGSATPSLESYYNVIKQRYSLLQLKERWGDVRLPQLHVMDMNNYNYYQIMHPDVKKVVEKQLSLGFQVLFFLNRRGFAHVCMCNKCGWRAECTHCDVYPTVHFKPRCLYCHHCDKRYPLPTSCPECNQNALDYTGLGTERVAEILQQDFPSQNILRVDRDSVAKKGALQDAIQSIRDNQLQLIVATQMLAKGHHFPRLNTVVVVDMDAAFHSSDFRALEKTSQLLMQVAGRAGREDSGHVYIQTRQPNNSMLQSLLKNPYDEFIKCLLQQRCAASLPPYSYWAVWHAESKQSAETMTILRQLQTIINDYMSTAILFGPMPAIITKKAGYYRSQLIIQMSSRVELHKLIQYAQNCLIKKHIPRSIRLILDIDPLEMH